jgi:hypothetical protein
MDKAIKLKVKKGLDSDQELKIIKLKGTLISKGYTEIIHIADENDNFYLNSFSTSIEIKNEAQDFILDFITKENLGDTITLLK